MKPQTGARLILHRFLGYIQSSPVLHLPTSPLLRSLLEETNLVLAKFVEDQTVHVFLLVPGWRHWRYYQTSSSSSFFGPYTLPPGLGLDHPRQGE